ncbi:hypothetical protein [Marinomonas algarum]|uniref:Cutinase n=1 Tax=Marinomonas algarum TaxID=2883105 RepID=A0A9X1LDZ6_9GAMM|nr:hypothetical protein [Marinomonas algarum]MCB5160466.1 hypothetical protein [Marinomonas algarum]
MMEKTNSFYSARKMAILIVMVLALYAPAKDLFKLVNTWFAAETIRIVDVSFGNHLPWQSQQSNYLTVGQNAQSNLSIPQIIYTKLQLSNPTSAAKTYRKIWLNFLHENGDLEYTTDYVFYNADTRQRLIGNSIELGPNSHIDVIAAHRFIPSYKDTRPVSMSVSWEKPNLLRDSACKYSLVNNSSNTFHHQCND